MSPTYRHTQRGPLWFAPVVPALGALALALFADTASLRALGAALAVVFALVAASFATLTVRDAGDHLEVRFGPLPVFGTRIAYDTIERVEPTRSRFLDGWGIHWVPGRGWTFNLWGMECVEVTANGRRVRIGTDDRAGLATFLCDRVGIGAAAEA
ncbi:MAG: hypothetical protein KDE27_20675 [Planctomycetes bacterium]|nr:hypothetical protein [Planctomycetota bacterium]